MTCSARQRISRGVSLVELIVALAIIGLAAAVSSLAWKRRPRAAASWNLAPRLAAARREAIRTGRPITIEVSDSGRVFAATAFPDGSIAADAMFRADPLTGHVRRDERPEGGEDGSR